MRARDAVDVLAPGYRPLFDHLLAVCAADDRIRAVWLGGSLARGDADQSSDLDVLLAVADDAFEAFAAHWKEWLDTVTPTVIARALPFMPGSLYSVTPTMERLDVVAERVSALASTFHRVRLLVIDKDGCAARLPASIEPPGTSTVAVAGLVEEFFRDYAMFHVVVEREDWLLGLEAIHLIRSLLYRLCAEANAPLPATGVKRWSEKLTAGQRSMLTALPAARARRDEVIAVHEEVSLVFVAQARSVCANLGVEWPTELEQRVCEHLRAHDLPHLVGP